jgi:O-antigen/teichoic acid export membrane protein
LTSILRRSGWATLDQAFASISNLLLSVAIARQSTEIEFGAFGLAFAIYLACIGASRAVVGDPTLLRAPTWKKRGTRFEVRSRDGMLSCSLGLGILVALLFAAGSLWSTREVMVVLMAVAAVIPGLLLFDAMRYWYFANTEPKLAALLDLSWLVLQIALFLGLAAVGLANAVTLIFAWGIAGFLPAVFSVFALRSRIGMHKGFRWLSRNRDLSLNFLGEFATLSGVQQAVPFLTAAFAGIASVGSIRAAQTILGPVNVVTGSASVVVLPHSRAIAAKALRRLPIFSLKVSLLLTFVVAAAFAVLILVPDSWGKELLGASWTGGRQVGLVLCCVLALNSLAYGATSGLRAMEASSVSLKIRLVTAPVALASVTWGAIENGALGAMWGLTIASGLQCAVWWVTYLIVWHNKLKTSD